MRNAYVLLLTLALAMTACSDKKSASGGGDGGAGPAPAGTLPPPVGGGSPNPPVYTSGATADLTIDMSVYDEYTGRVANAPSNFKINVDLRKVGTVRVDSSGVVVGSGGTVTDVFGGSIKISYQELNSAGSAVYYQGVFQSGTTTNEAKYNRYVTHSSAQWFKAFFEDAMGGLVIVVDSIDEFGGWNGKVFFKNFECGRNAWEPPCNPTHPKRCWLTSAGPYQCAAFSTGGWSGSGEPRINMSSRQYPDGALYQHDGMTAEGYTLLGTFTGMDSNRALNN